MTLSLDITKVKSSIIESALEKITLTLYLVSVCEIFKSSGENCTYLSIIFFRSDSTTFVSRHSSEIRGLPSTKCSSETLQNLLYFMYKKTHVVFFVFHFVQLYNFTL